MSRWLARRRSDGYQASFIKYLVYSPFAKRPKPRF
jgi:hypothetical protein